jgi:superfamily II DNA or RNA helicase
METSPPVERAPFRPYPHQELAFKGVHRELYDRKKRSTAVVSATGTGKTTIAAMLAKNATQQRNRTILFLAHRNELIAHAIEDFEALGVPVALEKADNYARQEIYRAKNDFFNGRCIKAVVASVQTLKGERLDGWPRDYFDEIYIDEFHHSLGQPAKRIKKNFLGMDVVNVNAYKAIADHFEGAKVVGFSATPKRSDGRRVEEMYESIAFQYLMPKAIRDGMLAPIDVRRSNVRIDLSKVNSDCGDLNQGQLEEAILPYMREMVLSIKETIGSRPFILFAPGRESVEQKIRPCELFAAALSHPEVGLDCRAVWGNHPDRDTLIAGAKAGEYQGLCNADLLTEGFDWPAVEAVVLCRATESASLLEQMIGRGLRLSPATGKTNCIVMDFDWAFSKLNICTPYHIFSPDGKADAAGFAEDVMREGILTDPFAIAAEAEARAKKAEEEEARRKAEDEARKRRQEEAKARSDEEKRAAREEALQRADERRLEKAAREENERNRLMLRSIELGIKDGKSNIEFISYDPFSSALSITGLADRAWPNTTLKASQRQVLILEDYGVSPLESRSYSREMATEMQTLLFQRHIRGMARIHQVRDLLAIGYSREESWSMTRREATMCIKDHQRRHKGA